MNGPDPDPSQLKLKHTTEPIIALMRLRYAVLPFLLAPLLLSGCFSVTRTERDLYTITHSDTTIREDVNNPPGQRENGTIYPSPRTVEIRREYIQEDSTVERYYPAFLRLGGIEAASFFAAGGSSDGSGNGLFGLYELPTINRTTDTKVFTGNMYRFFPYEARLRWFRDSPNWTIGTSVTELFMLHRDSSAELADDELLIGVFPIYVRKRFFFREEPPYIMAVPFVGFSGPWGPSYYVNLGATLDVGSYGGLNARAYAGFVAGTSSLYIDRGGEGVSFPYFGLGVSVLDFVNKTEELFIEWKDHDHSALEVSALNVDLVRSLSDTAGTPFLSDASATPGETAPLTGIIARLATTSIPVPIGDRRWWVGTSLFNLIALSSNEIAFGFLPIRTGYRFNLLYDELNVEPFGEFTYYPSTSLHVGARVVLKVPELFSDLRIPFTVNAVAGYVTGSSQFDVLTGLDELDGLGEFSAPYVGFGIGIGDVLFSPEEVMRK